MHCRGNSDRNLTKASGWCSVWNKKAIMVTFQHVLQLDTKKFRLIGRHDFGWWRAKLLSPLIRMYKCQTRLTHAWYFYYIGHRSIPTHKCQDDKADETQWSHKSLQCWNAAVVRLEAKSYIHLATSSVNNSSWTVSSWIGGSSRGQEGSFLK